MEYLKVLGEAFLTSGIMIILSEKKEQRMRILSWLLLTAGFPMLVSSCWDTVSFVIGIVICITTAVSLYVITAPEKEEVHCHLVEHEEEKSPLREMVDEIRAEDRKNGGAPRIPDLPEEFAVTGTYARTHGTKDRTEEMTRHEQFVSEMSQAGLTGEEDIKDAD